jgi:hypothetical protein
MFSSGKFSQLAGNECKGSLSTIANLVMRLDPTYQTHNVFQDKNGLHET